MKTNYADNTVPETTNNVSLGCEPISVQSVKSARRKPRKKKRKKEPRPFLDSVPPGSSKKPINATKIGERPIYTNSYQWVNIRVFSLLFVWQSWALVSLKLIRLTSRVIWQQYRLYDYAICVISRFYFHRGNRTLSMVWDRKFRDVLKFRPRAIQFATLVMFYSCYVLPSLGNFPSWTITFFLAQVQARTICKSELKMRCLYVSAGF